MKIFKPSNWGIYKAYVDIKNYIDFIKIIKKEKKNPKSKFNKWNLNTSYFYSLYFSYDIDETEEHLPDNIKQLRLIESLAPVNLYLDEELGFAECLNLEISQFYNDKNEPTLTYFIMYRFMFNKISFYWLLKWIVILSSVMTVSLVWGEDLIKYLSNII